LVHSQTAAVTAYQRRGEVHFHRLLDMAGHYRFRPRVCHPARDQTKGKNARNFGYVNHLAETEGGAAMSSASTILGIRRP
jgi:transposase